MPTLLSFLLFKSSILPPESGTHSLLARDGSLCPRPRLSAGILLRAGREDRLWKRLGQLSFLCLDAWPLHTVGREGPLWVPRERRKGWNSVFAGEQVLLEEGGQGETTEPHGGQGQAGCYGLNDMATRTHVDT